MNDSRERLDEAEKGVAINIPELKKKIYDKLVDSGWADKLKGFILSNDFDIILNQLVKDKNEGKRFVPGVKNMFKAFELCPHNQTRVIILGQDPYPYINVPDGLAFSCSITGKAQPSLEYIFNEIRITVYNNGYYDDNPDLERWAKQGILLLNTAFTVNEKKPGSHYLLWRPFLVYLLDVLVFDPNMYNTIFVFMGNKAKEYMDLVPDNFYKLDCSHPASAAHNQLERWDCRDIFNKINTQLEKVKSKPIIW